MKLLFDHNLSPALPQRLLEVFPGPLHVAAIDFTRAADENIADFAKRQGFVICTKDADFFRAASVVSDGPSVIWLRIGNSSTDRVVATLWRHAGTLKALAEAGRIFAVEIRD